MYNPNNIANEAREIQEIVQDYKKTSRLLNLGNSEELELHMKIMQDKYLVEKAAYNMTATIPPKTIQENALNFMAFLKSLLAAKGIKDLFV